MMKVYRLAIEVGYMEGTQLPEDYAGAFVSVYLRASDIKKAIELAEAELARLRAELQRQLTQQPNNQ